jgi:hypothetical protein
MALVLACCAGAPPPAVARPVQPAPALGLDDVSILLPLPPDPEAPVLATAPALIDPAWFDALVTAHHDIAPKTGGPVALDDFHVVALRFDLCDRSVVGPCPTGVPGRLRLVLQPLYRVAGETFAHDVALHALYAIPDDELAAMVGELRALAALAGAPPDAPLGVSPAAAAGNAAYLARLRALMQRYARGDNLVRLTVIGQRADSAAFAWVFRGLDRHGAGFAPLVIPGIDAEQQAMQVAGGDTIYLTRPVVDAPAGFALAANGAEFAAASDDQRRAALAALAAIQNPALHGTEDTQCVGCHVSSYLTARRAATTGIAPASLAGWFAASRELRASSATERDPRVVRAFGWVARFPAISQRVANDTAQALAEIDARYPVPAPPAAPP